MKNYISHSEDETKSIAEEIAKTTKHKVFALTGDLGTGKTIFAQGFAKGLGIKEKIISPTFVLIRQHKIPDTEKTLFHIDLYRLNGISNIGLEEILSDPNNIVLIEWAEKLDNLPEETVKISIQKKNGDKRKIILS